MKVIILKLIKLYQKTISPDHGFVSYSFYKRCRFYPSCSEYSFQTIERYGLLNGLIKSILRVLKCGPWSKGGIDMVNDD